ncbi:MAG: ABC transporter permease [Gemmatimonadaceae bacterium]
MTPRAEPPRLARRLLARMLPDDARDHIEGDLLELYARRCARDGVARARLWYWTEAATFSARFLLERLRDRTRRPLDARRQSGIGGSMVPSALDVRLALRVLVKYPVLSSVSVIGLAIAIAIGTTVFGVVAAALDPSLPLESGDRIVAVQIRRADAPGNAELPVRDDFLAWRTELTAIRDLGAFQLDDRNLIVENEVTDVVAVAAMSAAGFRVARVRPELGRPLLEDDERAGGPLVVVIGHGEWQQHFGGDPNIIGRTVRLAETIHTVVGVMPEDFRFPRSHGFWVPLRLDASKSAFGGGPPIQVFGRLADGVTLERARAQVAMIGRRMAAAYPVTHEHRRPTIVPFAHTAGITAVDPHDVWRLYLIQVGATLLLLVVAVNVAVLVYARTATRTTEIAVRIALGASRARVITQLFVEALVLSLAAAAIGLSLAGFALDLLEQLFTQGGDGQPFWFDIGLSPALAVYVCGLAILGGTVVGVVPALKVTGRRAYGSLQQFAARGSGMRLGPTWSVLIVAQVAITVAVLPASIHYASVLLRTGMRDPGYPAQEFLRARISLDREEAPSPAESTAYQRRFDARFSSAADALERRLVSEPGVAAAFVSAFPGGERDRWFEIEGDVVVGSAADSVREKTMVHASINSASVGLFELFDAPMVAGRGFIDADTASGSTGVIVDTAFAARLTGGNVVGRRIRNLEARRADAGETAGREPWLEIVGVVADPPQPSTDPDDRWLPNVYRAAAPTSLKTDGPQASSIRLRIRVRSGLTPVFTRRLRDMVAAIDPRFELHELRSDEGVLSSGLRTLRTGALSVAVATLSVLLLSAAGIYAMLSFTVAQRRREIGIRAALGANPRRILSGVFARASAQLGAGVAVGVILAIALDGATDGMVMGSPSADGKGLRGAVVLMPIVAAIVMAVGLLAALTPARRGLAVQPTEALRDD